MVAAALFSAALLAGCSAAPVTDTDVSEDNSEFIESSEIPEPIEDPVVVAEGYCGEFQVDALLAYTGKSPADLVSASELNNFCYSNFSEPDRLATFGLNGMGDLGHDVIELQIMPLPDQTHHAKELFTIGGRDVDLYCNSTAPVTTSFGSGVINWAMVQVVIKSIEENPCDDIKAALTEFFEVNI